MNGRTWIAIVAAMLWAAAASAADSWVLFGSARGFTSGCDPSYIWATETVFHNTSASDRRIDVLHQGSSALLPQSIAVRAGESLPLSAFVGDFPPLGLEAVHLDVPGDVLVEPRLEYRNVQPCNGAAPSLGPSGKIALPSFHLVDAQQPQRHYGLDLGLQSIRVNVGVYNAGPNTAIAMIEVRRPACSDVATTVVTIAPDSLVQVRVSVPPICASPANPYTPLWMVNATVTVDQPSFSYATTVSNIQPPSTTFGVGTP